MAGWSVEHCRGPAQELHDRRPDGVVGPTVWVHTTPRRALVLGASQTPDLVDVGRAESLDVEVCRRRSGGGIVLLDPATSVWIDVLVPVGGRAPPSDPGRLFRWVGAAWLRALRGLGVGGLRIHDGRPTERDRSRLLCFAGVGTGEVVQQTPDGPSKVVGLSQRRTRDLARVQGLLVTDWDPDVLRSLVRPDAWPAGLVPDDVRAGLGGGVVPTRQAVVDAVLASLVAARAPAGIEEAQLRAQRHR